MRLQYCGVRVYLQQDGSYKAFCVAEWADRDGNEQRATESSQPRSSPGEALAEALELAKALLPR